MGKQTPGRAFKTLVAIDLCLVTIYLVGVLVELQGGPKLLAILDVSGETNLPSWYSSAKLLLIGCIAFTISANHHTFGPPSRWFFVFLGFAFVFFSFDEAAKFHERLGIYIYYIAEFVPMSEYRIGWVAIYFVALLIAGLVCFRQILGLRRIYPQEFNLIVIGSSVYVIGAMGLEIFGFLVTHRLEMSVLHDIKDAAEEFMEMLGATFILFALLRIALTFSPKIGPARE